MDHLRTDAELLAATGHEPEAFGHFYRRHEQRIVAYFRQRVASAELAADLTAETFAAALLAHSRYRPAKGPAVGWLFGIAHNILRMSFRRGQVEQRARRQLAMPPLDLTDELIERIDSLRGDANAALAQLPDDQRRAIEARVLDERDYAAIGRELRCSPSVVRKRVSRGLQTLRHRLEET
jgi:RNA polymerase sigma-70 factor (ECF subfamily)